MQDQSIEAKQLYLRENILDKGHDPESFMAFCEENQGHIDLEEWSMKKLVDIVQAFVKSKAETTFTQEELDNDDWTEFEEGRTQPQKTISITVPNNLELKPEQLVFREEDWSIFGLQPKKQQKQPQEPPKQHKTEQRITPPPYPNLKTPTSQKKAPNFDAFSMSIPGPNQTHHPIKKQQKQKQQKISTTMEFNQDSSKIQKSGTLKIQFRKIKDLPPLPAIRDVIITKTEQRSKNFLKGEETYYQIKFMPCGNMIEKKFSDLRKLKSIMHKIYPHIRLPYLEPQGWLVSSSEGKDPDLLNKYKFQVIQFFKYILITNETLKKSKIVRVFSGLLENSGSDIKKYETVPKPRKFLDLCLPGNELQFSEFESLAPVDKYMSNVQLLISDIDAQYQKLKKAMDNLFYNYQQVSKSLTEVSGIFENLQNSIVKFNIESDTHKEMRVFEGIKQVCLRMKEQMSVHLNVFKQKFYPFFKYQRENMTTFKQINQIRIKMYSEYQKQNIHLHKHSKNQVIDGDMLIDEVCKNNKNTLYVQNMFWSHFALEANHTYWNELRYKINEKLTIIAYDELDNENSNLNFWNTVIKRCVV